MRAKREWTRHEVETLVTMTLDGSALRKIERQLRMGCARVRSMQLELGLISPDSIRQRWKSEELAVITKLYADAKTEVVAAQLGKKVPAVYQAARKLGLKKTAECLALPEVCGRGRKQSSGSIASRFKPGIVPHNKGRKTPGVAPGRMATTQFRKGTVCGRAAQLVMPLGATRLIDGYLYRKIRNVAYSRNWKLEHYLIWEAVHGPVPAGHALVFRDGDRTHVHLDNLELLTRADLARRNTIHKLPEDLKQVIRLNASIKRRIRKIYAEKQNARPEEPSLRDARSA